MLSLELRPSGPSAILPDQLLESPVLHSPVNGPSQSLVD